MKVFLRCADELVGCSSAPSFAGESYARILVVCVTRQSHVGRHNNSQGPGTLGVWQISESLGFVRIPSEGSVENEPLQHPTINTVATVSSHQPSCSSILPLTQLQQHPPINTVATASSHQPSCSSILASTQWQQHPPFKLVPTASSHQPSSDSTIPNSPAALGI